MAVAVAAAAAAAARQGHVAQNNYGNGNDNKVWACWAQPFVVTADSPGLLTPCLNAVCACVCEIHFSMSVTKTDKCPHSANLHPFLVYPAAHPLCPSGYIFYVPRLNSRTV